MRQRLLAAVVIAASAVAALAPSPAPASTRPRILLIGDSIMDQEGNHAAVLLRQAGADVVVDGRWGSGLLTRSQYDLGRVRTHAPAGDTAHWLSLAPTLVDRYRPDVIAVHLDYNYWQPHPRDAAGNPIDDPHSAAFRSMVAAVTREFVHRLRAHGATVAFVAPLPDPRARDPRQWNAIWSAYQPVLTAEHVAVISPGGAIAGSNGLRVETKSDCAGWPERVRPATTNIHLARFGAGLVGTQLARGVARLAGVKLPDENAPGQPTATIVASPSGAGYWVVGCDASAYAFGQAARNGGAASTRAGHDPVVAAATNPTGTGVWFATASGRVLRTGIARGYGDVAMLAHAPVVGIAPTVSGNGYWLADRDGHVTAFGDARSYGSVRVRLTHPVVGIAPTPTGRGYWLVASDGGIFAFGDARYEGSTGAIRLAQPVVAMAPSATGRGYWLLAADGGIFAFGDAHFWGSAFGRLDGFRATGIARRAGGGLWVVSQNGAVVGLGTAALGGTAHLALFLD